MNAQPVPQPSSTSATGLRGTRRPGTPRIVTIVEDAVDKGEIARNTVGEGRLNEKELTDKHRVKLNCGRNWYRKCLALCALADFLPPPAGGHFVEAAEKEVSSAARLEGSWISVAGLKPTKEVMQPGQGPPKSRRQLKSPLLVGRGPQFLLLSLPGAGASAQSAATNVGRSWRVLYGGSLRTHGGLGVSRQQKDLMGSGLRLGLKEVTRIYALRNTEIYVGKRPWSSLGAAGHHALPSSCTSHP